MKILVTGGMGYLGCVTVSRLMEEGYDVRVLDSLIYGNNLGRDLDFELVRGDIRDYGALSKALKGVDVVIHLAAIVGEPAANLDKELAVTVNYLATRKLAELCAEQRARLIFASTCSVYGAKPNELLKENDDLFPLSIYAISKLAGEEAIEKMNPDSVIFRLGTLFGYSPRMRFDLVVNLFIAQAVQDGKITVFGGSQYRPVVHVQDVAVAFVEALNSSERGVFNLGGFNYRIIDIAEILRRRNGCEVKMFEEIRDPRNYAVDSALAKKTFGVEFNKDIEFAINEIESALNTHIKDYKEPIYNNKEWLERKVK